MKLLSDPALFLFREKSSFCRTAWQKEKEIGENTANYGWNAFQHQEPPPTTATQPVHMIQTEAGDRSTEDAGDRQPRQEQRDRLCLFPLAKPVRQIETDSGEVAGLRQECGTKLSQPAARI